MALNNEDAETLFLGAYQLLLLQRCVKFSPTNRCTAHPNKTGSSVCQYCACAMCTDCVNIHKCKMGEILTRFKDATIFSLSNEVAVYFPLTSSPTLTHYQEYINRAPHVMNQIISKYKS